MDSKLKYEQIRPAATSNSSRVLAITILVLASLLTVSGGVLIYISLNPGVTCARSNSENSKVTTFQEQVDLYDPTRGKLSENLEYNSNDNILILTSKNGEFNLQDYNKGLHITKDVNSGICYVIPTNMSANEGRKLEKSLDDGATTFSVLENPLNMNIIPGKISDSSFLPDAADDYCFEGYQWLTTSSTVSGEHQLIKRRAEPVRNDIIIIIIIRE